MVNQLHFKEINFLKKKIKFLKLPVRKKTKEIITHSRHVDWKPTASERGKNGDEGEEETSGNKRGGG